MSALNPEDVKLAKDIFSEYMEAFQKMGRYSDRSDTECGRLLKVGGNRGYSW